MTPGAWPGYRDTDYTYLAGNRYRRTIEHNTPSLRRSVARPRMDPLSPITPDESAVGSMKIRLFAKPHTDRRRISCAYGA